MKEGVEDDPTIIENARARSSSDFKRKETELQQNDESALYKRYREGANVDDLRFILGRIKKDAKWVASGKNLLIAIPVTMSNQKRIRNLLSSMGFHRSFIKSENPVYELASTDVAKLQKDIESDPRISDFSEVEQYFNPGSSSPSSPRSRSGKGSRLGKTGKPFSSATTSNKGMPIEDGRSGARSVTLVPTPASPGNSPEKRLPSRSVSFDCGHKENRSLKLAGFPPKPGALLMPGLPLETKIRRGSSEVTVEGSSGSCTPRRFHEISESAGELEENVGQKLKTPRSDSSPLTSRMEKLTMEQSRLLLTGSPQSKPETAKCQEVLLRRDSVDFPRPPAIVSAPEVGEEDHELSMSAAPAPIRPSVRHASLEAVLETTEESDTSSLLNASRESQTDHETAGLTPLFLRVRQGSDLDTSNDSSISSPEARILHNVSLVNARQPSKELTSLTSKPVKTVKLDESTFGSGRLSPPQRRSAEGGGSCAAAEFVSHDNSPFSFRPEGIRGNVVKSKKPTSNRKLRRSFSEPPARVVPKDSIFSSPQVSCSQPVGPFQTPQAPYDWGTTRGACITKEFLSRMVNLREDHAQLPPPRARAKTVPDTTMQLSHFTEDHSENDGSMEPSVNDLPEADYVVVTNHGNAVSNEYMSDWKQRASSSKLSRRSSCFGNVENCGSTNAFGTIDHEGRGFFSQNDAAAVVHFSTPKSNRPTLTVDTKVEEMDASTQSLDEYVGKGEAPLNGDDSDFEDDDSDERQDKFELDTSCGTLSVFSSNVTISRTTLPGLNPPGSDRRSNRKNKSLSKYRRLSIGIKRQSKCGSDKDVCRLASSFKRLSTASSPSPRAKSTSSSWRRSKVGCTDRRSVLSAFSPSPLKKIAGKSSPSPVSFMSPLSERNYRGKIIGGSYQHCFEDSAPVVAPPGISQPRVTMVNHLATGEVELNLFFPSTRQDERVCLPASFHLHPANPTGYLIGESEIAPRAETKHFYLHKHPDDWVNDVAREAAIEPPQSSVTSATSSDRDSWCLVRMDSDDPENVTKQEDYQRFLSHPVDWNNSFVASLVLEFLAGNGNDLTPYMTVCKAWAVGVYGMMARMQCTSLQSAALISERLWKKYLKDNIWGSFLNEGACKKVYRVQNQNLQLKAVSVMDLVDMEEKEMTEVVAQELEISVVCSSLSKLRICPNFVVIFNTFRSNRRVPEAMWNSQLMVPRSVDQRKEFRIPKAISSDEGSFQFIEMELCRGGDVEDMIRRQAQFDVPRVRVMFFQMCFSLYCGRSELSLRHFDIKCLNFFATNGCDLFFDKPEMKVGPDSDVVMEVDFGDHTYYVQLLANSCDLIKLADFGTSVIGTGGLGEPVTVQQFTTLENTPPEFLICGSASRQAHSADTFCLGLTFFHLLTGEEPYEELMHAVLCPTFLLEKLKGIWLECNEDSPYWVIHEVIDSLDEEDSKDVLYHTLYRYLVLFGIPPEFGEKGEDDTPWGSDNPVWQAVLDAVGLRSRGRTTKQKTLCRAQYTQDCEKWSIAEGKEPRIASLRQRLEELDGQKLFTQLLHFNPSRRCTMFDALRSSVFVPLRNPPTGEERGNRKKTASSRSPNRSLVSVPYKYFQKINPNELQSL